MIYPPSPLNVYASQLLGYFLIAGLVILFAGEFIFSAMNFEPGRRLAAKMKDNSAVVLLVLFLCNSFSTQLLSTGAFELFYNDRLVFSRLQTGEVPDINRLLQMARNFSPSNLPSA